MRKEAKILIGLTAVVGLGLALAANFFKVDETTPTATPNSLGQAGAYGVSLRPEFVRDDSPTLGPKTAKVTIVEFLDPECESCRAFHPIMKETLKAYEGGVHFVVRYMAFHTSSSLAVAATESAGLQGKYWEMQDLLFNAADEWSHKPTPESGYFIKYAADLGLDVEKFKQDLNDPKWQQKIARDMADGKVVGVNGTPTIFINGERLKNLGASDLRAAIEAQLRTL